jgi:hypothetical protein
VVAIELADALRVHQLDRQVTVLDARGGERGERRLAQLLGGLDVDQVACWRRGARSAGACCYAYSLYAATIR